MNIGVIFDLDGTMVANTEIHGRCWTAAAKKYGIEIDYDFYFNKISGNTTQVIATKVLAGLLDYERALQLCKDKEAIYREKYAAHLTLLPGLENFLLELKAQKIPMIIASNAPIENLEIVFKSLKLTEKFGLTFVDPRSVSKGKPAPDFFLKSAEILKCQPSECLVFEDSLAGFGAAEAAGMKYVAISAEGEAYQKAKPVRVIKDYCDYSIKALRQDLE